MRSRAWTWNITIRKSTVLHLSFQNLPERWRGSRFFFSSMHLHFDAIFFVFWCYSFNVYAGTKWSVNGFVVSILYHAAFCESRIRTHYSCSTSLSGSLLGFWLVDELQQGEMLSVGNSLCVLSVPISTSKLFWSTLTIQWLPNSHFLK